MLLWTNVFYETLPTRLIEGMSDAVLLMLTTANRYETEDHFYLFLTAASGSLAGFVNLCIDISSNASVSIKCHRKPLQTLTNYNHYTYNLLFWFDEFHLFLKLDFLNLYPRADFD